MKENSEWEKGFGTEAENMLTDNVIAENAKSSHDAVENHIKKISIAEAFSGSLSNKLKILSDAIEEIDQLIELRKALSKLMKERIDKEIFNSECQLLQVKPWQLGHSNSIEMRRLGIEREILSLNKEKRSEDVRAWEHISSLMKLKRQFLIEYQNLNNTRKTLEGSAP